MTCEPQRSHLGCLAEPLQEPCNRYTSHAADVLMYVCDDSWPTGQAHRAEVT